MAELVQVPAGDVALRLRRLREAGVAPPREEADEARWAYREAAALLSFFDAGTLRPSHRAPSETALRELVTRDCERVATTAGPRWRLAAGVRRQTLGRLGRPQRMLDALAAVPADPQDLGRAMAQAYLTGTAPPVEEQTVDQLHGSLLVIEWLAPLGLSLSLPDAGSVRGRVALATLMEPLRALVGDHFVGRQAELDRLNKYVGVPPGGSVRRRAWRIANVLRFSEKPPMVIHGPGGMGKSTLVARFVLEQADLGLDRRFPFAYLSFDRADLDPRQPLTLLAEAIRQFAAIYPWAESEAFSLEASTRATMTSRSAAEQERGRSSRSLAPSISLWGSDELDILARFGQLVQGVIASGEPLLWVLDAFEQAQRHGDHAVDRVWGFLNDLQAVFPRLRVVFAGRAPLAGKVTDELPLHGFDRKLAVAFLRAQLPDLPVRDRFLGTVARQLDANPLSLKLAAELLRREGTDGLNDQVFFQLRAEEVQGVLYRRILDHLDDPDLRRIANPGLVVRRLTADVIAQVLAVPCGLGPVGPDRARELLARLRQEASLVEPVDADTLAHRPDVRREMLPLLRRDHPDVVRSIHRRAISYYRDQDGPVAKAEELYHRLALGQSAATIDKYWQDAAGATLERALDELPAVGRVYLAERLGFPADPEALAEADEATWIRQAARTARELLDAGQPQEALVLIRDRPGRAVRSALLALEVEALAALGQPDEALKAAESGLTPAAEDNQSAIYVEVALLASRLAEDAGQFDVALKLAERAGQAARATRDHIGAVSADVARLRLYRRSSSPPADGADLEDQLREQVIEECRELTRAERSRNPSLLRDAAAEVGFDLPELIADAARVGGLDIEGAAGRILDDLLPSEQISSFASFAQDATPAGTQSLRQALGGQTVAEQGRQVSDFLNHEGADRPIWNDALVQAYRDEVDKPSF